MGLELRCGEVTGLMTTQLHRVADIGDTGSEKGGLCWETCEAADI